MKHFLKIKLNKDTDGTCEVHGSFQAHGYSAHGSAWFNLGEIETLGTKLRDTYPLKEHIAAEGGHWENGKLKQLLLGLYFSPFNQTGKIICNIKTGHFPYGFEDTKNFCAGQGVLITNYENLRSFGHKLIALTQSKTEEAVLEGDADCF